jgi:hypothetical protein
VGGTGQNAQLKGGRRWLPVVEEWRGPELGIGFACHVPIGDGRIVDTADGLESI